MTGSGPDAPTILAVDGSLNGPRLIASVKRDLLPILRQRLPGYRWFGDKDEIIAEIAVADAQAVALGGDWLVPMILDIRYQRGSGARYFVPLAATLSGGSAQDRLATISCDDGDWTLCEAFERPSFAGWLLDQLAADAVTPLSKGALQWRSFDRLKDYLSAARTGGTRVTAADQSNTSVIFGDALFLKVFRRLRSGLDPDQEIGCFLHDRTSFHRSPKPVGAATYQSGEATYPIAVAQCFVPSVADGWTYSLHHLGTGDAETLSVLIHQLGVRTAELHTALASDPTDPSFSPEVITERDAHSWMTATRHRLVTTATDLMQRRSHVPPEIDRLILDVYDRQSELLHQTEGFAALVGRWKVRVHGDYHLGQVLRTVRDDWLILDFEGEPSRSLEERRAKTSPLKDVAGLTRSLAYAHCEHVRRRSETDSSTAVVDSRLTSATRDQFIRGYRSALGPALPLIPEADSDFQRAIRAWELDKALYEVWYELNHRPDWLALPLATLVDQARNGGL